MEFTKDNIESGQLNFDGEIVVKADSQEFEYLHDMYINNKKATGILKEFGYPGTIMVVDMRMAAEPTLNAVFTLKSVDA
ncbi:MAG: hypothetical protein HUJ30_03545 [Gammaproteobacteria bacterium]|nr:hypothetical protein [Gammaproteobacteria bacterium]